MSAGCCAGFGGAHRSAHYPPSLTLVPQHIDITLKLDMKEHALSLRVSTTVRASLAGAQEIVVNGISFQDLAVESEQMVKFSYNGSEISVVWADPFERHEERVVHLTYKVVRPLTGVRFFAPRAGEAANCVSTDHETERARYWLACVDHPLVRPTLSFAITAPAHLTILANGQLAREENINDNLKQVFWELAYPCPSYLVCFAVGDYVRAEGGVYEGKDIAFFGLKDFCTEEQLRITFGHTRNMLAWMTKKVGAELPWPKYYQFIDMMPARVHMAMENISLVSFCGSYVLDERLRAERSLWTDGVVLHEMAHTFFGDAVVIRDFAHAWLKESWATVMEWEYAEDHWDQGAFHFTLFQDTAWYLRECATQYVRPIVCNEYESSMQLYDAHLYPGGAWRLRLLRHRLGAACFWEAVTSYLHTHQRGVVETIDFRRALEAAAGYDLGRFFDQWVLRPGCMQLKVTQTYNSTSNTLNLTVTQTQTTGLFDVELPCSVEHADGTWELISVSLTSSRGTVGVSVSCPACPRQVVIDEHGWVPHALTFEPGESMLLHTARHGPTALARMRALAALGAQTATAAIVSGLAKVLEEEQSIHVRVIAARALGSLASIHAVRAAAAALATQTHPLVLSALVVALGSSRAPDTALPALRDFVAKLQQTPYSYTLMGNTLTALGALQSHDHLSLLIETATTPSHWLWTRRGALAGLGALRSEAARAVLLQFVRQGDSSHTLRACAARALATACEWLPITERAEPIAALEAVCSLDETFDARLAAAEGLVLLAGPAAVPAIKTARSIATPRDFPALDQLLHRATAATSSADAAIAQLRATIDKLTVRLDELQAASGKQ